MGLHKSGVIVLGLLVTLGFAAAQSPGQSHKLSEINPIDTDFDMSDRSILNLSSVKLNDGTGGKGLVLDDFSIRDSGNILSLKLDGSNNLWKFEGSFGDIIRFHDSGDVDIPNGTLDMEGNRIANVSAPQNSGDAVNKSYVDNNQNTIADDQNLSEVLGEGNSAGSYTIDMSGNNITDSNKGNVSVGQSLKVYGDVWTQGADLAEIYSSSQELEAGEVVAIDTGRDDSVVRTEERFQETVAGVVSTDAGQILNWQEDGYPIALEGKVPVKISEGNGEIERGDRIVPASEEGEAMRCETWDPLEREDTGIREIISHNEDCRSSTIGKALENSAGKDEILVKVE